MPVVPTSFFSEFEPSSPLNLQAVAPRGSLIYDRCTSGRITNPEEEDTYTLNLDPSQVLTVVVDPDEDLQVKVELWNSFGVVATSISESVGQDATLQTVPIPEMDTYYITVTSADGTSMGAYVVSLLLNSAVEEEAHDGPLNDSPGTAQSITDSFIPFVNGADRAAVVGQTDEGGCIGPDGFGYVACPVEFQFEDISATGNHILEVWDTKYETLRVNKLDGFQFNFYGTTYDTVYVSVDGLVAFGEGHMGGFNSDLSAEPLQAIVAPYWDDLFNSKKVPDAFGDLDSILWEVRGNESDQRLIVQWDNVESLEGLLSRITFQVILKVDGSMLFNYWNPSGISATVGIKDAGPQGENRLSAMLQ